ncbi:MAG: NAD-dependent protein deacylase [Candidatus Heimdallarchaeota archaeon]|nr:NAD-dependent protein deacylase [Candidatus Heimdallarchaeota archaeon]
MNNWKNILVEILNNISSTKPSIVAIVGAGASAASGLATYRGSGGLWEGKLAQELASVSGFTNDPETVWRWYKERIKKVLQSQPNQIHHGLVKLEKSGYLNGVITQNVDGLHRLAGQSDDKLIEIHGTLLKTHCFDKCGLTKKINSNNLDFKIKCECGSYQRPSVIWFGELLENSKLIKIEQLLINADILLIIGTSGVVYPVAQYPFYAKENGSIIIEFNIEETPFKIIDNLFIKGPADKIFFEFVEVVISTINSKAKP